MALEALTFFSFFCHGSQGFSSIVISPKTSRAANNWQLQSSPSPDVSVVSVCTAELCCCQEEGGSALEILDNLNSRSLPYPIEEAPCLGACGGGAMVAIDFEDGSAALVSGLTETLSELGLELGLSPIKEEIKDEEVASIISETSTEDSIEQELLGTTSAGWVTPVVANTDATYQESQSTPSEAVATLERPKRPELPMPKQESSNNSSSTRDKEYKMSSDDVRERMRAEAANDSEQINPWMNMASYLAGKAKDKILGN